MYIVNKQYSNNYKLIVFYKILPIYIYSSKDPGQVLRDQICIFVNNSAARICRHRIYIYSYQIKFG